jgi:hypothetical protein
LTENATLGSIHKGVYAEGSFITQENGKLFWTPDPSQKQLYWQENGLWLNMTLSGESAVSHKKGELILYAESLH